MPKTCFMGSSVVSGVGCGVVVLTGAHIIRTAKVPFLESRTGSALITSSRIIAAVGMIIPFTWLGGALGFVPLPATYWMLLLPILLGYAILTHLMKTWFIRRYGLD